MVADRVHQGGQTSDVAHAVRHLGEVMSDESNPQPPNEQSSQSPLHREAPPTGREWLETESLRANDPDSGVTFGGEYSGIAPEPHD